MIAKAKNLVQNKYYRITIGASCVTGSDQQGAYIRFTYGGFTNARVGPATHGGSTIDSGHSFSASRTWIVQGTATPGFDFEASANGGDAGTIGSIQIIIEELPHHTVSYFLDDVP